MARSLALARLRRAAAAPALAAALLAGCGGGFFLGIEIGDDGLAPSVSLAASATSVRAGDIVQLVAAASDENGIDNVAFYQLDALGTAALLGADGASPYQWSVAVGSAAGGSVRFFARATDGSGVRADSNVVTVNVTP